jgi:hypothetical protein
VPEKGVAFQGEADRSPSDMANKNPPMLKDEPTGEEHLTANTGESRDPLVWNPEREEIRQFLRAKAPPLAELYEGAVSMLYQQPAFPGRLRFVCHAARDISNRLAEYAGGARDAEHLAYDTRLEQLAVAYEEAGFQFAGPGTTEAEATSSATVQIPVHLHREMEHFILAHRQAGDRNDSKATRLFMTLAPESASHIGTLGPALKQWKSLRRWFNGSAHDSGPGTPIEKIRQRDDQLFERFAQFEAILGSLVGGFYRTLRDIDAILGDANRQGN